jgi:hypothetical protein
MMKRLTVRNSTHENCLF